MAGNIAQLEEHFAHLGDLALPENAFLFQWTIEGVIVDVDRAGVTDPVNIEAFAFILRPGSLEAVHPQNATKRCGDSAGGAFNCFGSSVH